MGRVFFVPSRPAQRRRYRPVLYSLGLTRLPATFYVDAVDGSDSNDGMSEAQAWQTIAKVNSYGLIPSDGLRLKGGQTHDGNLLLSGIATTSTTRITIQSYGGGRATINPENSYSVKVQDMGYVTCGLFDVQGPGIDLIGSFPNIEATTTSTEPGVSISATTIGTWYRGIVLYDISVDGCMWGFRAHSTDASATAAFRDVSIMACRANDCGVRGITSYGTGSVQVHFHPGILFQRFYVSGCKASNIRGITAYDYGNGGDPIQNGDGIVLWCCEQSGIERSYATNCGEASPNTASGGPCGMYLVECVDTFMRDNEADTIRAPESLDGVGFDIDAGCSGCVVERNLARNCDGSGLLAGQVPGIGASTWENNQIRWNVVQNCGRLCAAGGFKTFGTFTGLTFAHNTIFHDKASSGPAAILATTSSAVSYVNNIFSVANGGTFGSVHASSTFHGNCYHVGSGSSFSLTAGSIYGSLAAMQTADFEKLNGVPVGVEDDPEFDDPGNAGVQWDTYGTPVRMTNYDIGAGSPCASAGVDPLEAVGVDIGSIDFHYRPARFIGVLDVSGYAIGAMQPLTTAFVPQTGGGGTGGGSIIGGGIVRAA